MQALVYYRSVPRYLLCGFLAKARRRRFFPRAAPLELRDVPEPPRALPSGEELVQLKPLLCGVCGSDLSLVRGVESMLLEPYASFPAVLGHEILARVERAPQGSGLAPGDRVVVDPVLSCRARGVALCRYCRRGDVNLCENFLRGGIAPGMVMGYNASLGGGMAERCAALPDQCRKVPEAVPDETAVLADSLASALQPALDNPPVDGDVVVVYGAGIIGQHLVRCLRAMGAKAKIVAVARYDFQRELALAGGADEVLMSPGRKALGHAVGATFHKTTLGGGNLEGGADLFFDCVGSRRSVQDGLLALRAGGRFVLVATIGALSGVDFSAVWQRQLTVTGTVCYGRGVFQGREVGTYSLAVELLASGAYPVSGLLTHSFPLCEYEQAFAAVFDRRTHRSMKVAIDLR